MFVVELQHLQLTLDDELEGLWREHVRVGGPRDGGRRGRGLRVRRRWPPLGEGARRVVVRLAQPRVRRGWEVGIPTRSRGR